MGWSSYVYEFDVNAGTNFFGAAWDEGASATTGKNLPWFAFCEADGSPTLYQGNETPNAPCSAAAHDQWMTIGPDGNAYRTWHPQIDEYSWCYYGHEHGSDPALFDDTMPAFDYVPAQMGESEGHAGFKVYVMDTMDGLHRVRLIHHFGTASTNRVCARFHTVEIKIRRNSDGALMADLKFMADFGKSVNTDTHEVLTPPDCPDQGNLVPFSNGVRLEPIGPNGTSYSPWRYDIANNVLGLRGSLTFNTPDVIVRCSDNACSSVLTSNGSGTERFVTDDSSFNVVHVSGFPENYCTDMQGKAVVACTESGAIPQFMVTGFNLGGNSPLRGECSDPRGWGGLYYCGMGRVAPVERENSIPVGGPN